MVFREGIHFGIKDFGHGILFDSLGRALGRKSLGSGRWGCSWAAFREGLIDSDLSKNFTFVPLQLEGRTCIFQDSAVAGCAPIWESI